MLFWHQYVLSQVNVAYTTLSLYQTLLLCCSLIMVCNLWPHPALPLDPCVTYNLIQPRTFTAVSDLTSPAPPTWPLGDPWPHPVVSLDLIQFLWCLCHGFLPVQGTVYAILDDLMQCLAALDHLDKVPGAQRVWCWTWHIQSCHNTHTRHLH